jgi:two-component system sensor histidine kinase RegB
VGWCLLVIAAAGWMNLSATITWPGVRLAGNREAVLQLAFDLVELAMLLGLTGGLKNPFALLLIAPVTVGAATLPTRHAAMLGILALVATAVLGLWSAPLPWPDGAPFTPPTLYVAGIGIALAVGIVFTAAYAWQASAEASRMELALAATQAVLAREQRLSALGGLAAAAAHELGTPLATIQVVTKEMARGLEPGPLLEDIQLLIDQAERCRAILRRLSQEPDTADAHHARMSLSQLLDEVADPHRGIGVAIDADVSCAPGAAILEVRRMPEVLHGLSSFVENAVDFAESAVDLTAYYDDARLVIEVRDDGPGFSPDVISKLGQPYVTTRSHGENSRSSHMGMGLGFFIAKTLLERTGGEVEFRNAKRGGACITVRWPRERIATPEPA